MHFALVPSTSNFMQCSKLRFYFVRPSGAHIKSMRPGIFLCTPLKYCNENCVKKNVRKSGAQVQITCARPRKCSRRAPSAPSHCLFMLRSIPGISRKPNLSLLSGNLVKYLESKLFNWSEERWGRFVSNKRLCSRV